MGQNKPLRHDSAMPAASRWTGYVGAWHGQGRIYRVVWPQRVGIARHREKQIGDSRMKVQVGMRFERLQVIGLIPDSKNPKAICVCDCGAQITPQRGALINGRAKSCGCLRREKMLAAALKHGEAKSPAYKRWASMKQRCINPNDPAFANYGGRGITFSQDWTSFENFVRDMGQPPEGTTLERLNTNGPYSKENCVWADWNQQAKNKRVSKRWEINGVEFDSSTEAAKHLGVDPSSINRKTNGYVRAGRWHPPVPGYTSRLVYQAE